MSEDNVKKEDEMNPDASDGSRAEDTAHAQNNEPTGDSSSDTNNTAGEVPSETLNDKRRLSFLGTVSSTAIKALAEEALKGSESAKKALESDEKVREHLQKKMPEQYNALFGAGYSKEEIVREVKNDLSAEQREQELKNAITRRGIKGEEDFDKVFEAAKALKNFSVENAAEAAVTAVKGPRAAAQPYMGAGQAAPAPSSEENSMSPQGQMMANEFMKHGGFTPEDIQKYHKPGTVKFLSAGAYAAQDNDFHSFQNITR